jgi:pyridoxal phosphate enzyme (YggS family)
MVRYHERLEQEGPMISEALTRVREQLAEFPNAALVAVSKRQPVEKLLEAYRLGQRDFGENYVQELLEKDAQLREQGVTDIRWHFLGHLQTNKVKQLLPVVSVIHAVGSFKLAQEISKRWQACGRADKLAVFLEVNIDREDSKGGLDPDLLPTEFANMRELPGLDWRGLMCIPSREGGLSGDAFRRLANLERGCRPWTAGELSMGMSEDYPVALREGALATRLWIRIGTGIFGARV